MNTFTFDVSDEETKKTVLADLEILDNFTSNPIEYAVTGLRGIANHSTDGDYKRDYFYFRALAGKLIERIERLEEQ